MMDNTKLHILLGSNSPRRNELLAQMGLSFTKVSVNCDESFSSEMPVNKVAAYLAQKKSDAYTCLANNEILITADTIVIHQNKILNKPSNGHEAYTMLKSLSNSEHSVHTGVCIRTPRESTILFTEETIVKVKELSDADIHYYIDKYAPFDKAGAYGIQEWFGLTQVEYIHGCFYNVVGLPTARLAGELGNIYKP